MVQVEMMCLSVCSFSVCVCVCVCKLVYPPSPIRKRRLDGAVQESAENSCRKAKDGTLLFLQSLGKAIDPGLLCGVTTEL